MFYFFHRKKKIVLDCFTSNTNAFEYTPIIRGSKAFPDWWKKLPTSKVEDDNFNMLKFLNLKKCYGFNELFKRSIILQNWTDLKIKVTPNNGYSFQLTNGKLPEGHIERQYEGGFVDYYNIKLMSPWFFREKTGVHFMFVAAEWNLEKYDFKILPGCVEYRVNHGTNVNIMLPKKQSDYYLYLPLSLPLVHMIPMVDDAKIVIKNHLVTDEEIKKYASPPTTLEGINKLINIKNKHSKCPLHF